MDLIWCTSMTRGLTIWNSTTGDRLVEVTDYYTLHMNKGVEIDYLTGCFVFTANDHSKSLVVLGGNQEGVGYVMSSEQPDVILGEWKGHQVWIIL